MMRTALRVRGLRVAYPTGGTALEGIDLDLACGEVLLILGASGSGKSTLLQALCRLIPDMFPAQVEGTVQIADGGQSSATLQNLRAQMFTYRVEREVACGPENQSLPAPEVRSRTEYALAVMGLTALRDRLLDTLSSGQMQRTLVAALLAMRPTVIAFDEPTSNLDASGRRTFYHTVKQLRSTGAYGVLLVEHRTEEALHVADRVVLLDTGHVVGEFAPQTLLHNPDLLRRYGVRPPGEIPWERASAVIGDPVLIVKNLAAGFGSIPVFQELNLTVSTGEVISVTGPNGVGKTTLAQCIVGLLRPKAGQVAVAGQLLHRVPIATRPSLVGMVTQDPEQQLFTDRVATEPRFGSRDPGADAADHWIAQFGLEALRDRHPLTLSYGEKQRLALATAVAQHPRLLVLDEPTSALDGRNIERLADAIDGVRTSGTAVVILTHDEAFATAMSDRVVSMEDIARIASPPISIVDVEDLEAAQIFSGNDTPAMGGLASV